MAYLGNNTYSTKVLIQPIKLMHLTTLLVSATGTNYRFSPIRPKLKKKKRQVQETLEIEPENPGIPKGPTVEELKNDISSMLENCDDVEKLQEIIDLLE